MENHNRSIMYANIKVWIAGLVVIIISLLNVLYGATVTSAQSGLFSEGTTWIGGTAPAPMDNIIIATGHTVTLDEAAASFGQVLVYNITIQEGAVLDNSVYNLKIANTYVGNPVYSNNGIHNGTGNLIMYNDYETEVTGSGTVNCNIEITGYGIKMATGCNLTVNANIQHSIPGNFGMSNKEFISCWTPNTHLTVNGDIITDPLYMVGIYIVPESSITVNGDMLLPGGTDTGSGSTITNQGSLHISGDLLLGPFSAYCQNYGTVTIGGDLLGSGSNETYFLQEAGARLSIGGSIFPTGNEGLLNTSGTGLISFLPIEPNTVEYNGTTPQIISLPMSNQNYSQLEINNTNAAGVSLISDITVNGGIVLTEGKLFLGSFNLILSDSATITGMPSASAMAVASGTGEFKRNITTSGNYLFPVGDTNSISEYSPVNIEFTSGTFTEGTVGVKLSNTTYPGSTGNNLNRYWTVSSTGVTDFNCNAQFYYNPADVTGIESSIWSFRLAPDTIRFAPADTILHMLTTPGLTSFGSFTGMEYYEISLPLAYDVTGSGSYCAGEDGLPVGLSDSEPAVTYTLLKDGLPQEPTVAGTGDAISFGLQTTGTYTIEATNSVGTVTMTGNATIVENPLPIVMWTSFDPDTLCIQWSPVLLTGGSPEGGFYSGNGVTDDYFDPASAGAGTHDITYHYTDDNGCSGEATLSLFVDLCTDVHMQDTRLTLFPNPATETVTLDFNGIPSVQNIKLYNQAGRIVYRNDNPESQSASLIIPVNEYPAGQYLLVVNISGETLVRKLLIAR
jgi:hypothetical protein